MTEPSAILMKLSELPAGEFCIVASHSMNEIEVAISRSCGYFYVSPDGLGWAIQRRAVEPAPVETAKPPRDPFSPEAAKQHSVRMRELLVSQGKGRERIAGVVLGATADDHAEMSTEQIEAVYREQWYSAGDARREPPAPLPPMVLRFARALLQARSASGSPSSESPAAR